MQVDCFHNVGICNFRLCGATIAGLATFPAFGNHSGVRGGTLETQSDKPRMFWWACVVCKLVIHLRGLISRLPMPTGLAHQSIWGFSFGTLTVLRTILRANPGGAEEKGTGKESKSGYPAQIRKNPAAGSSPKPRA